MFDVIVVGGGVIGATILRELTKYRLKVAMVEKESDVAMGQSRANSGIVHAGYDAKEGTLKAKFNLLGNLMMPTYTQELGVKYINNGSIVVAYSPDEIDTLYELKSRGEKNGVEGLEVIDTETLRAIEPNISPDACGALLAKTGGIVCPYELTIASIGNAMDNGASLYTDYEVCEIVKGVDYFIVKSTDGRELSTKIIINSAGIGSGDISKMAGDDTVHISGRKGEYILLDRESQGYCTHTIFKTPTSKGKGILISPTVDGNILLGPTAQEVDVPDTDTTSTGLDYVKQTADSMCVRVPHYNTITSFAGVRAYSDTHDFVISHSDKVEGLINVAGIESPGLTSAPAIAKYVVEELVSALLPLVENTDFDGRRQSDHYYSKLDNDSKNKIIAQDPRYGKIICRCEQITEGEIVSVIRRNPRATTIDAVKRRLRAGMGRCQGGFCQPQVAQILARELGIPLEEVTKSGKNSRLIVGKTK